MDRVAWIRARVRLFGLPAVLGFLLFVTGVLLCVTQYDLRTVSTQTFSLAALCFGFGILGWSGSVLAGGSVEDVQRHLDTGINWTEADSRRAMARISGAGAGGMVGVIVVVTLLGGT